MKQITFCGRSIRTGKIIFGDLFCKDGKFFIGNEEAIPFWETRNDDEDYSLAEMDLSEQNTE